MLRFIKNKKIILIVALSYLILTLINLYPSSLHLDKKIIGDGGDSRIFLWDIWWTKTAVMQQHSNIYYTDYIFYPNGTSLAFHSLSAVNTIPGIPLYYLTNGNIILVYNILVIVNFALAGIAMFYLAYYLTNSALGSFIAGYIFTFSPFHMARALGHLNALASFSIPLFILFLIRFHRNFQIKDAIISGVFLALSLYSNHYYFVILIFFYVLYTIYFLVERQLSNQKTSFLRYCTLNLIMILTSIILSYPYLSQIVKEFVSKAYTLTYPIEWWNPDILTFILPGNILFSHRIFEHFDFYRRMVNISLQGAENQNYIGIIVLIILIISLIILKKDKIKSWIIFAVCFLTLNLGTKLVILGHKTSFKLPYFFIYSLLPLISIPDRFNPIFILSISVIIAFGLKEIFGRLSKSRRILFFSIIMILIGIDFAAVPFVSKKIEINPFYYTLRSESEDFAVLDLYAWNLDGMYYQTVHNKKILDGHISRERAHLTDFVKFGDTVITELYCNYITGCNKAPVVLVKDIDKEKMLLKKLRIKYILVNSNSDQTLLSKKYQFLKVYADKKITAYRVY